MSGKWDMTAYRGNNALYGRVGHVEIEDANGNMLSYGGSHDSLDFKFNVEETGDIYVEFSVGILGLGKDTINDLITWTPQQALSKRRLIRVFAGYDSTGEDMIAEGIVWSAIPTPPPEMWLNMKCMKFLDMKDSITEEPAFGEKKTVGAVFEKIADILGLSSLWEANDELYKKESNFQFMGLTKDMLATKFKKEYDVIVYQESGMLVCIDRYGEYQTPQPKEEISPMNGLIQLSEVGIVGAKIVTRLDDRFSLYSWLHLDSWLMEKVSGDYLVISKKHTGHFRGEEWQTEFDTLRAVKGT